MKPLSRDQVNLLVSCVPVKEMINETNAREVRFNSPEFLRCIHDFTEDTSLRLYADDTTAYASDTSPVVLEYIFNSDLQVVCTWLQHNYLQINATKTQAMAIGPINYRYTINLQDNNKELTDSLKMFCVTLDEIITFKPHIQEQLKKACAKAAALRKLCKFIPQDVMILLYKAYVLPHLEYCSPLLHTCPIHPN